MLSCCRHRGTHARALVVLSLFAPADVAVVVAVVEVGSKKQKVSGVAVRSISGEQVWLPLINCQIG
jgi:hypothetical protein